MTTIETHPAWVLQDFACSKCGGSLESGYEERHYGIDAVTGYSDVELVCGDCAELERVEDAYSGPDALEVAKCHIEDADLRQSQ